MNAESMERELRNALAAHGVWKRKLRAAIETGRSMIDPAIAHRDDCCPFGKWLNGPTIAPQIRESESYRRVARLHREFHEAAGNVLELVARGEREQADAFLGSTFALSSSRLTMAMTRWHRELRKDQGTTRA